MRDVAFVVERIRQSELIEHRNDRLIGVEYSNGFSLAYVYDGNLASRDVLLKNDDGVLFCYCFDLI